MLFFLRALFNADKHIKHRRAETRKAKRLAKAKKNKTYRKKQNYSMKGG
jgi:hypothetical protein